MVFIVTGETLNLYASDVLYICSRSSQTELLDGQLEEVDVALTRSKLNSFCIHIHLLHPL